MSGSLLLGRRSYSRLTAVALLVVAGLAFAQTPQVIRWTPGCVGCSQAYSNGMVVRAISIPGIVTIAAELRLSASPEALVKIENLTGASVDVLPSLFQIQIVTPKPRILQPLNIEKELAKSRFWSNIRAGATGAASGAGTTQSTGTVTDQNGNTSRVTINTPNDPSVGARNVAEVRRQQAEREAYLTDSILRSNTLPAGGKILGRVQFQSGKATSAILRIPLGPNIYEIPFE